jgi:hypothetical protein
MTDKDRDPTVSGADLQSKWEEITAAVKRQTERKVAGVSALAVGGVVLGLGAIGVAFWLGRRSAKHHHHDQPPPSAPQNAVADRSQATPAERPSRLARTLEPALDSAVDTVVAAAVKSAVNALTNRLRNERQQ